MNMSRYRMLTLSVGIFIPLFGDTCPEGTTLMESYLEGIPDNSCVPDLFATVVQSSQNASYFFESVTIEGAAVESNDWVSAFNDDICVGTWQWDIASCLGDVCGIAVMGVDGFLPDETVGYMSYGDIPTFQIYDASEGNYYYATPSENIAWAYLTFPIINNLNVEDVETAQLSNSEIGHLFPNNNYIANIYPNPFNPITNIEYNLPKHADIELNVYNIHGRNIHSLIRGFQIAGYHSINWDASNYPSGVYLIRLESGKYVEIQKVMLIK